MRVFHLITTIERGGAENQLLILCREQIKLGLEVKVFYLKGESTLEAEFVKADVPCVRLKGKFLVQIISLRKILSKSRPDVLHAHLPRSEVLAAMTAKRIPFVISRHNAEKFLPGGPGFLSRMLSRYCVWKSSARIAISNQVKNFVEVSNETLESKPFSVVHYGFPFSSSKSPSIGGKSSVLKLLAIGRLVPQKDFQTLLNAMSILKSTSSDFELTILGDGPLLKELRKLAFRLNIQESVQWMKKVPNPDMYLREAALLLVPSLYEGFGMIILEAMEERVPIICSDIPVFKEILGDSYPGFFEVQNPESLAHTILFSKEKVEILLSEIDAQKGRFRSDKMAQRINSIYLTLID